MVINDTRPEDFSSTPLNEKQKRPTPKWVGNHKIKKGRALGPHFGGAAPSVLHTGKQQRRERNIQATTKYHDTSPFLVQILPFLFDRVVTTSADFEPIIVLSKNIFCDSLGTNLLH